MLREWRRVLRVGGELILELPCMNKVIGYIAHQVAKGIPLTASFTWFVFWGDPKYRDPHMCHKWGYTEEQLVKLMREVGFSDVRVEEPRYHFKQRDMRIVGVK